MGPAYRLDANSLQIATLFGACAGTDPWSGGEVSIGQFAPVIVRAGRAGRPLLRPMHWGYPAPGQSTERAGPEPLIWVPMVRNVDSPFWIGNLRHGELRCLVPMTQFVAGGSGKQSPRRISLPDAAPFAVAGIWRDLTDMPVFAILVTDPPAHAGIGKPLASVPLILRADDWAQWLGGEWKQVRALIDPDRLPALSVA